MSRAANAPVLHTDNQHWFESSRPYHMTKQYNIVTNNISKIVYSESYLTALIEESMLLKKSGVKKFTIDVFNKDVKLASYIRS